jgi:hypothetical protein
LSSSGAAFLFPFGGLTSASGAAFSSSSGAAFLLPFHGLLASTATAFLLPFPFGAMGFVFVFGKVLDGLVDLPFGGGLTLPDIFDASPCLTLWSQTKIKNLLTFYSHVFSTESKFHPKK